MHIIKTKVKKESSGFNMDDFLSKKSSFNIDVLAEIAQESIEDFKQASPSTEIASNWSWEITINTNGYTLTFNNDTIENGENIAIIIDVGHATAQGYWVPGKNYLKEPIEKTYKRINEKMEAL